MWAFTLLISMGIYPHTVTDNCRVPPNKAQNNMLDDETIACLICSTLCSWHWWADVHDGSERGVGVVCKCVCMCGVCEGRWWWVIVKELNNVSGGWSFKTALNYMHTVDTFYIHIWQWPCGSDGSDNENPRHIKDPLPIWTSPTTCTLKSWHQQLLMTFTTDP